MWYILEKTPDCHERTVGKNMDTKAILVRSQMKMKDRLLETGGRVILVGKWQRTWLNSVLVFGGR